MAVSVVSFSFSRAAQPAAQGPTLLAFSTTSYQQLLWTPEGLFGLVWLSLPHLVTNFSNCLTSCLDSYIIVQRPINRPLNLWNGMFDRHQAEIIVMQFSGHSLPVHQSIAAQWDLHLVPYYQPSSPARSLSINGHWDVSLPAIFGMACLPGPKVKIQHSFEMILNNSSLYSINAQFTNI